MTSTKLSGPELEALLNRQSADFVAEMHQDLEAFRAHCRAQQHEPSLDDLITMAAAKVRAQAAVIANEIVAIQLQRLK